MLLIFVCGRCVLLAARGKGRHFGAIVQRAQNLETRLYPVSGSTFTDSEDSKTSSQGTNTSSLSIQLSSKMMEPDGAPAALTIQSFVQLGYNLVFGPKGLPGRDTFLSRTQLKKVCASHNSVKGYVTQ